MKRILQIDSCLGILSTGKITENIARVAMSQGWECHIAHGARAVGKTIQHSYQVSSKVGEYVHYFESLVFDRHGLGSRLETKRLIKIVEKINPDIIHLHCVHGYYINYRILFEYLYSKNIPVVWTFHDCWAFTGHCAYFDSVDCKKWITGCHDCPLLHDYPAAIVDRCQRNYSLKKKLFGEYPNMTIVPVSDWLHELTQNSFLRDKEIITIHNGVDTNIFHPMGDVYKKRNKIDKKIILGVAAPWSQRKGLNDFIRLSGSTPSDAIIVLVGLAQEQIDSLPNNIIGIKRTSNATELAEIYSAATIFVNPTYSDNFPTTNIEALACGTPVITYNTGGSPEAIDDSTGRIINTGDIDSLSKAIYLYLNMSEDELMVVRTNCTKRAEENFDKEKCFKKYLTIYDKIINNTKNV